MPRAPRKCSPLHGGMRANDKAGKSNETQRVQCQLGPPALVTENLGLGGHGGCEALSVSHDAPDRPGPFADQTYI